MTIEARLNGIACLASAPVSWARRPGVRPSIGFFDLAPEDAEALLENPIVDLRIEGPNQSVQIERLFVVGEAAGENPFIRRVKVADQRWWWPYRHVVRRYNWRRMVGVKRLADPQTLEIQPLVDDVAFAPWSLRDEVRKWTAAEILTDILGTVIPDGFLVPSADAFEELPIENLEIDDSGDAAVLRALEYLAGAGISIGADGEVRLYSKVSGADGYLEELVKDEVVGGGHVRWISRKWIRPRKVTVLFTREHEVRFDFEELSSATATVAEPEAERIIDNVLPVPDFSLELASGSTVAQGTYITIPQALTAWGNPPGLGRLDLDDLQRAMVPFIDLWSTIKLAGLRAPKTDYADWAGRVSALQQHYRTTFRIRREWMDRIFALRPSRVALLDTETGARGPAVAYADYAWISSARSLWMDRDAGADLSFATNVISYPRGDRISARDVPAPAQVSILDHDQGILHLDYLLDPYAVRGQVLPSMVELEGVGTDSEGAPLNAGPHADFKRGQLGDCISYNSLSEGQAYPKLTSGHKVAVILTAIPGSPNTNAQLFPVEVIPDEAADLLPKGLRAGIASSTCLGPEMTIRVPASVETARIPWLDDESETIERAFGVIEGDADLSDLVINLEGVSGPKGGGSGGASLKAIAQAAAARIYGSMADRVEGALTVDLLPMAEIEGWIGEVEHEVTQKGETFTHVVVPDGDTARQSLLSFLDAGTRAVILKLARPGKD